MRTSVVPALYEVVGDVLRGGPPGADRHVLPAVADLVVAVGLPQPLLTIHEILLRELLGRLPARRSGIGVNTQPSEKRRSQAVVLTTTG